VVDNEEVITRVLRREVTPSTGCTDPAAIGIAVAYAFNAAIGNLDDSLRLYSLMVPEEILKAVKDIKIRATKSVLKNSYDVGIPNTNGRKGHLIAIAMALLSDPVLGLNILGPRLIDKNMLHHAEVILRDVKTRVGCVWTRKPLIMVDAIVRTTSGIGRAVVRKRHDSVVLIERDGKILYRNNERLNGASKDLATYEKLFRSLSIDSLLDYVQKMPTEAIDLARKCIAYSKQLSDAGAQEPFGMGVGYELCNHSANNGIGQYIKARTASATDARMFGVSYPVMSVAGSGNQGITATMPIVAFGEKITVDERRLLEAVTLSCLITIYATYHSSRLSAACGPATKAGAGASAGLAYCMCQDLPSQVVDCAKMSVQNFVASTPGIICDGAKYGCALKVAAAADSVFTSAVLAINDRVPPCTNGILGRTVDQSIRNMGRVMKSMNRVDKTTLMILRSKA
jgi:L-cysteine desulfidase